MFSVFLALKYLKPKRSITSVITILTICGVMLGVAIMIIVRAVMTGFGLEWEKTILRFKPHIVVSADRGTIRNEEARCVALEGIEGVEAASPSVNTRVLIEHQRLIQAPILIGTDATRIQRMAPLTMVAGEFDLSDDGVVMGIDLANSLNARIGSEILIYSPVNVIKRDEIYLPERTYLRGVFDSGRSEFDSNFIFVSLALGRDMLDLPGGCHTISMRVDQPQNFHRLEKQINAVQAAVGPGFAVRTWQEEDHVLFSALATEKNMMVLLMAFITIVAIFCVINTLIVITVQKTHEIGLLKALGFSSRQVMFTFVFYGWFQCIVGTLLGVGLAFLVLFNLQNLINLLGSLGFEVFPKEIYGLSKMPWKVNPGEVFQVAFLVIFFCSLASFLPAWRAVRMDPVTALRKE